MTLVRRHDCQKKKPRGPWGKGVLEGLQVRATLGLSSQTAGCRGMGVPSSRA